MTNDVSSLENEITETRERLARTLDELLYRAHPKTIVSREVSSVKARFVDEETGEPKTDAILRVVAGVVGTVAVLVVIRKLVRD